MFNLLEITININGLPILYKHRINMNTSQISQKIITILTQIIPSYDVAFWSEETELFGAIAEFDSMVIVTLIGEIEEQFDVVLDDDDISAENFETVATLTQLVLENTHE